MARKLAAVAAGRRPVVVGNGTESEPLSGKDAALLRAAPHLVLDGLQLAAEAVGARRAILAVHPGGYAAGALTGALAQRQAAGLDRVPVELAEATGGFLAGQETALVSALNGGLRRPAFTPPRVSERGVGGHPTLVQNVETLSHLALIARYGAAWFRSVGTARGAGQHAGDGLAGRRPGRGHRGRARHPALASCSTCAGRCRPCWSAGITVRGCRPGRRPGWR